MKNQHRPQERVAARPQPIDEEFMFKFIGTAVLTAIAVLAKLMLVV
ncbi:MAG: hypothetical protein KC502_02510 [Myxococcales bacterium]|nr:hypothetical protein [Myxococcales bacterium]